MKRFKCFNLRNGAIMLMGVVCVLMLMGCENQPKTAQDAESQAPVASAKETGGRGAAEIWAQACINCHNARSPEGYSDAHWDITAQHMRHQAKLTAVEYRKIREFLKAAN